MAPPAEISIPTTSVSNEEHNNKPYTLYNITLRLPLRSFVVQKRYSEFAALHQTFVSDLGAAPPAPLPAKSWFTRTVSNPQLTEDRRLGLEKYLRAIAESPDRRWRDTSAWRQFLHLPSSSTSNSAASAHGIPNIGPRDANAAAAADPGTWLDLHRELRAELHEARLCLARRDAAVEHGASGVEHGAAAKRALVKAGSLLGALADGLAAMKERGRLGEGELRRRRDLVAAARDERDGLDRLSASLASASSPASAAPAGGNKAELVGGAASAARRAGGRVLGAPLPETERTQELDNGGVLQLQRTMMQEQDDSINTLAAIVGRQKQMGLAIKHEVDEQTAALGLMDEDADRVQAKLRVAKDRARKL